MKRGFIFNQDLCVNCKSCSVACAVENGFNIKPRSVLTFNTEASADLPLSNLSIACNHCEIAVCMIGCPASAYSRDPVSGAVIINDKKCIGCKYCSWNCPYDAPKYDPVNHVIGKCNLCYSWQKPGMIPACAAGCPTGALSYGNIDDFDSANKPVWFPDERLNPALAFTEKPIVGTLRVVPASLFKQMVTVNDNGRKNMESEWSLVVFSFLTVLSVSIMASSIIKGVLPDKTLFISISILPALFSVFHLGKWHRAWRAVTNIKGSPLSREILIFVIYLIISCYSIVYEIPLFLVVSSIIGFILLISIDTVYYYSVRTFSVFQHSGQTFLTSLLIASFLSDSIIPFLFIMVIKIILLLRILLRTRSNSNTAILRFVRMAFLLVAGASFISGISYPGPAVVSLFIAGELIDRVLFYLDFEPPGLNVLMNNHLADIKHEKERD